jgi:hypothetical protein
MRPAYADSAAVSTVSIGAGGAKMLTPNGADDSSPRRVMSAATASAVLYPAARKPKPPACATAAARPGVEAPPASGAWTIGTSSARRSIAPTR